MPYSVAARNDEHRNDAAIALQDAGVDRALAVDVTSRLPGKVAKALWMQLREARKAHRCPLPESIQQAPNSGDGTYRP